LSLQDAAEDDGVEGFRNMAKRFTMSPEARRKERQERQERKAAEERAKQEAEAKAKQEAEARAKAKQEAEARAKAKQEAEARAKQEAEAKAEQEALEQARDIKRRWDNFYKFQRGSQNDSLTKSDTGRFITSTSPSKIADILLGKVPTEEYPHISLGKAMDERIGQPTDYRDEFKKRKDWQRKQRFGHDDMQEDAGEIEDAE
jgi:flagellar biosynthesis GTPase FlhF